MQSQFAKAFALVVPAALLALAAPALAYDPEQGGGGYTLAETENFGRGPLAMRNQQVLALTRLALTPTHTQTVEEGRFRFGVILDWSSMFGHETNEFLLDAEVFQTQALACYGITDRLEAGINIPFVMRGGGVLDNVRDFFHDTFGLSEQKKLDEVGNNHMTLLLQHPDAPPFFTRRSVAAFGDITFYLKGNVYEGAEYLPAVSLKAVCKAPTGSSSRHLGGIGWDAGALLALSKRIGSPIGDFYLHGNVGVTHFGSNSFEGIPLKQNRIFSFLGLEYQPADDWSVLIQAERTSRFMRGLGKLSSPTYLLGVGAKHDLTDDLRLEFAIEEDYAFEFYETDANVDFGFHFGILWDY